MSNVPLFSDSIQQRSNKKGAVATRAQKQINIQSFIFDHNHILGASEN